MNRTERALKCDLEQEGYTVFQGGWPDFLAVKDGKLFFIECKSARDSLRPNQRALLDALRDGGLNVSVLQPEPWRARFSHLTA